MSDGVDADELAEVAVSEDEGKAWDEAAADGEALGDAGKWRTGGRCSGGAAGGALDGGIEAEAAPG